MGTEDLDRLDREVRRASRGPAEEYAQVLERAIAQCEDDAAAAEYLDVLEMHSELADTYDRLGRVEEALRHADALIEHGYRSDPDPRCRRAEILTRHGRLAEAVAIWDAVAADTPDDVWVYNNAGVEYGAIGEHELALSWLTRALELAVRTGDKERLLGQLRDLRAASLAKLGREPDELQTAVPTLTVPARGESPIGLKTSAAVDSEVSIAREPAALMPVALAWLRAHSEAGMPRLTVVPVRSAEFIPWVADNAAEEPDPSQLRAQYAADVARDPSRTIAWPPGRNQTCWCGSGRKYKNCCGAPGVEAPR